VESSFRLGRVVGVEVGVNWSWLVVFALITWSLAAGVFPDQDPGRSQATYVVMAVIAAGLFFASLLGHELGHAVAARREGMELDGITLWLFGGVARFKGQFASAGAELRIALAGPLVSLVIGVACSLLAWAIALPGGVDGALAWIGYVNLILLAFNMLPALPLDGGRVLRALLWWGTGRQSWATLWASRAGSAFGLIMMAIGGVRALRGETIGGLWFVFIGLFLYQAARASRQLTAIRERLEPLRVAQIMSPVEAQTVAAPSPRDAVTPDASAWQAFLKLGHGDTGRVPVVAGGQLVGVVRRRDFQDALTDRPGADVAHRAA
jgi:Zn-dependent protease